MLDAKKVTNHPAKNDIPVVKSDTSVKPERNVEPKIQPSAPSEATTAAKSTERNVQADTTATDSKFNVNDALPCSPVYYQNTFTSSDTNRLILSNNHRGLDDELPFPPPQLMQYSESIDEHQNGGRTIARRIQRTLNDHFVDMADFNDVLDFGCSNGRVLRNFHDLATQNNYWGCDINANTIWWNIENLSPPFDFFVNSTMPGLPVKQDRFDFCVCHVRFYPHG